MRDERQTLDRALSLHNTGDIAGAAKLYRRILDASPNNTHALHLLGVAEAAAGNIDRAKSLLDRSLQSNPTNLQYIENYAAILHRAGDHEAALKLSQRGLQIAPTSAVLLQANAAALMARGLHSEALPTLKQFVRLQPGHLPAHFMLASVLAKTGQHEQALESYDRALRLNPTFAEAHLDKGTIHFSNRRFDAALAAYDQALAVRPDFPEAWLGRAYALTRLGRREDALVAADKALALRADLAEAWVCRGNLLLETSRLPEAAADYDRALAIRPGFAAAWSGHGNICLRSGRHQDAVSGFDRALDADPNFAEAWLGRGIAHAALGRHDEALEAVDRALALDHTLADAWLARGQMCYLAKRYDEALAAWGKVLELRPGQSDVEAASLRARMHYCDWTGFDASLASIRASIRNGRLVAPFMFVAAPATAAEQLQCARQWIDSQFASAGQPVWRGERYRHDRVRIGYLSADFHEHATTHLMAGMLEHHDRSRFEVTGISVGPDDGSDMRRRIEVAFERFIDAKPLGDDQIAQSIRTLEVDILVDLKGYTHDARTGVFAKRPAPIQVNYLGFPGTIGAGFIDYIVADRDVIPESEFSHYAEKVVWLPDSYQANDRGRAIADKAPVRAEHALPETAFVFCCFNDNYKITPDVFSRWMRILLAVEDSVLWLFEENSTAADNLRREAAARGVAPQRLVFARRVPSAEHLARHRCADLFLDTLPYGAHTTASDALWTGLPVVTLVGETFAGRVGASLLNAVHLPELVTTTAATYERLAIELGNDRRRLATLKTKLADNRLKMPLYDTAQFTRNIEAAFAAMMERQRAGLPPDHIRVAASTSGRRSPAVMSDAVRMNGQTASEIQA